MTIPTADRPRTSNSGRWLALILLCAAQFMMVLDFSIVNVAKDDNPSQSVKQSPAESKKP